MGVDLNVAFENNNKSDRNFFLFYVALIWTGIRMGFGGEIVVHLRTHAAPYPLIVHFHAAAFVGWLALLTTQVLLIRTRRVEIHRKLGVAGAFLALTMVVLGPTTAIIVDGRKFGQPGADPAFLSVQLTDILAFAGLVTAAIAFRHRPPPRTSGSSCWRRSTSATRASRAGSAGAWFSTSATAYLACSRDSTAQTTC